jgi:S-DNA-T family DNA segregation ATPase FtsK/SpoIIIE
MGKKKRATKTSRKKKTIDLSLNDERIPKILGIVCFLLAIYLAIAFISYMYTWKLDQDQVLQYKWNILFESETSVANWLGRLGAVVSNMFFYWGFGLPSIVVIFLLTHLGFDLIKKRPLSQFWNVLQYSFVGMAFLSISLEFLFRDSNFSWGGAFGQSTYGWLSTFLGNIGLLLLLLFSLIGSAIWYFNPNFEKMDLSLATDRFDINLPSFGGFDFFRAEDDEFDLESKPKKRKRKSSSTAAAEDKEYTALAPSGESMDLEKGPLPKTPGVAEGNELEFEVPSTAPTKRKKKEPFVPAELEISEENGIPIVDNGIPMEQVETTPNPTASTLPVLPIQEENIDHSEPYDPTLDLSGYKTPSLELLVDHSSDNVQMDRAELDANKDQIIKTLLDYKIEITKIRATIGPTVTLYEIVPAPGVRISKIKNLEDDIALTLSALGIRIIAPIPGKGTIGIEVPNKNPQMVGLKEVLSSDKYQNAKFDLPIALGKTISNEVFVADLAKMPHLLIAGATGQGKSVGINTILMSLLYKKHPSQVKLVLVDPKKVELFPYAGLKNHFLSFLPNEPEPILTETSKVIYTLNSLCMEMDSRYDLLKAAKARNIKEYNKKFTSRKLNPNNGHKFMPYIVLVIDEFADLIMTAGKEVEMPIARIAQLARAVGIHLIIATQRPSVNIITGIIKANFPARLAFKVTSKIDSRTILDSGGAEQLIGRGDMILALGSDNIRLQCAFVDTPEVESVLEDIENQRGYPEPFYLPEYRTDDDISVGAGNMKLSDLDPMFETAARLVVGSQSGSTSNIQRKLSLGYNRAGRIMDQLEALGIVGAANGSKPREVFYNSEMEFENFWENMKNA